MIPGRKADHHISTAIGELRHTVLKQQWRSGRRVVDPHAMLVAARNDVAVLIALGPVETNAAAPRQRGLTGERYWRALEDGAIGLMRGCGRPTVDTRPWDGLQGLAPGVIGFEDSILQHRG